MAKTPNKNATPAEPAATIEADGFMWDTDIPEASGRGGAARESGEMLTIKKMPAPREMDGVLRRARVFFPASNVAASITDEAERQKATDELVAKLHNRIGGITRRIAKKTNMRFVVRKGENDGKAGVTVWRAEDATPEASEGATSAAT